MHGFDAGFELHKQVAVSTTRLGPGMHSHRRFRNHSQSSLTADAQMIDIDAVRGLGHGSRRQHTQRRDHSQRDYHILDLAVLVALHSGRPGGDPPAERGVQEGIWKVTECQAVSIQLLFQIGTKGAGLDARRKGLCIHCEHAPHAPHIE